MLELGLKGLVHSLLDHNRLLGARQHAVAKRLAVHNFLGAQGQIGGLLHKDRIVANRCAVHILARGIGHVDVLALARINKHANGRLSRQPPFTLGGIELQIREGVERIVALGGNMAHVLDNGLAGGMCTLASREDNRALGCNGTHKLRKHRGDAQPVGQKRDDRTLRDAHLDGMRGTARVELQRRHLGVHVVQKLGEHPLDEGLFVLSVAVVALVYGKLSIRGSMRKQALAQSLQKSVDKRAGQTLEDFPRLLGVLQKDTRLLNGAKIGVNKGHGTPP